MAEDHDDLAGDPGNPAESKDREALYNWVAGDIHAGNWLTTKYFPRIQTYFKRRVPEAYEDLVSETFLELSKSISRYRADATVQVFIYSIARNVLRQYFRKRRRSPEIDTYTTSLGDIYGKRSPDNIAEREEHEILRESLRQISIDDLDLLELRYWQGLTGPELRDLFKIKEGTVRSRLRTALERLREKYREVDATPGRELPDTELEIWIEQLRYERA